MKNKSFEYQVVVIFGGLFLLMTFFFALLSYKDAPRVGHNATDPGGDHVSEVVPIMEWEYHDSVVIDANGDTARMIWRTRKFEHPFTIRPNTK